MTMREDRVGIVYVRMHIPGERETLCEDPLSGELGAAELKGRENAGRKDELGVTRASRCT